MNNRITIFKFWLWEGLYYLTFNPFMFSFNEGGVFGLHVHISREFKFFHIWVGCDWDHYWEWSTRNENMAKD